jgi:hypothetical protein
LLAKSLRNALEAQKTLRKLIAAEGIEKLNRKTHFRSLNAVEEKC